MRSSGETEPSTEVTPSGPGEAESAVIWGAGGSGKTGTLLRILSEMRPEQQRFAILMIEALGEVSTTSNLPETELRGMLFRLVQAGRLQERRAPAARRELAKALGPTLRDIDPVPYATVEQARRLSELRGALLRQGALTTAALAKARGLSANTARQWISRQRQSFKLFTVAYEGETLVPAFLLDENIDPRPEAREPIRALREAGEDGWALWAWFATPSAWLNGAIPGDVLTENPDLVAAAAKQRAASEA